MLGFLYRAFWGSLRDVLKRKNPWTKLYENWKAILLLPAVYMGLAKDFWQPFDRYRAVEDGLRSTFFIIPFKNHAGTVDVNRKHAHRATRYDVYDVKEEIKSILLHGCEIGVHGIDAWRNTHDARKEFEQIREVTGTSALGIRMHWLYFNDQSPRILEDAGFAYDSTLGYNETVGYRGGTTQVYRPIGLKKLLELPMHIQDTALFFPDRMALTEKEAWVLIQELLENANRYGGVLTINWHDRSLAPERLWQNSYIKLLDNLKESNVWIDNASPVVRWFEKRRSASFEEVCFLQHKVKVHINSNNDNDIPDLLLRVHTPDTAEFTNTYPGTAQKKHLDIPFANVLNNEFPL
jgi:peptidoglycan/xylan/chitin deacetylase (PgdA/CDA1 family)